MTLGVLHVGNTAGIPAVIAKFQRRLWGAEAKVLARAVYDPFGFAEAYPDVVEPVPGPAKRFLLRALREARHYDIVHVHGGADIIIPWLRRLYRRKRIVVHYHGCEIRGRWEARTKYWRLADAVLYATPDLAEDAPLISSSSLAR